MAKVPTCLAELVPFLREDPTVTMTDRDGNAEVVRFRKSEPTGLWFEHRDHPDGKFLPINCRRGAAAAHEGGLEFDDRGFTFTKFGKSIRVDYMPDAREVP